MAYQQGARLTHGLHLVMLGKTGTWCLIHPWLNQTIPQFQSKPITPQSYLPTVSVSIQQHLNIHTHKLAARHLAPYLFRFHRQEVGHQNDDDVAAESCQLLLSRDQVADSGEQYNRDGNQDASDDPNIPRKLNK